MTAYHQGQLDFFCAVYAFINALRLLFGIQLNQARELLAVALEEISARPALWNAVLRNRTDHHWAIPYLLGHFCRSGPLALRAARLPLEPPPAPQNWLDLQMPPERGLEEIASGSLYSPLMEFGREAPPQAGAYPDWTPARLWPLLQDWLPNRGFFGKFGGSHKQKRCLILRFHRFIQYQPAPLISHWSTGREFHNEVLRLYDCTASKQATHSLALPELALHPAELSPQRYLALEPSSLFFLERM